MEEDQNSLIYDAAVLRMAVCLEHFVGEVSNAKAPFGDKVSDFINRRGWNLDRSGIIEPLREAVRIRNRVAHMEKNRDPRKAVFGYAEFSDIRRKWVALDKVLERETNSHAPGIRDLLFSVPLRYPAANAGDMLKHGALHAFVGWFVRKHGQIRVADSFGGRPWNVVNNDHIVRRWKKLPDLYQCARKEHRRHGKSGDAAGECFYGSGHIAKQSSAGRECEVWASDMDTLRRSDLAASGLLLLDEHPKLQSGGGARGFNNQNGYGILRYPKYFDLILLDPYSDLLRSHLDIFDTVKKAIGDNPELFVMVFVLDMQTQDGARNRPGVYTKHKQYMDKMKEMPAHFSIRCPKITDGLVAGEDKYETEILLFSRILENKEDSRRNTLMRGFEELCEKLNYALDLPESGGGEKARFCARN